MLRKQTVEQHFQILLETVGDFLGTKYILFPKYVFFLFRSLVTTSFFLNISSSCFDHRFLISILFVFSFFPFCIFQDLSIILFLKIPGYDLSISRIYCNAIFSSLGELLLSSWYQSGSHRGTPLTLYASVAFHRPSLPTYVIDLYCRLLFCFRGPSLLPLFFVGPNCRHLFNLSSRGSLSAFFAITFANSAFIAVPAPFNLLHRFLITQWEDIQKFQEHDV